MLQHTISSPEAGPQRTTGNSFTIHHPLLAPQSSLLHFFFSSCSICRYFLPPTPEIVTPPGLLQPADLSCPGRGTHHGTFLAERSRRQRRPGAAHVGGSAHPPAGGAAGSEGPAHLGCVTSSVLTLGERAVFLLPAVPTSTCKCSRPGCTGLEAAWSSGRCFLPMAAGWDQLPLWCLPT